MLDHVSIQCTDLDASAAFYDVVLATLGCRRVLEHHGAIGYGSDFPRFWLGRQTTGDGFRESHIAFTARCVTGSKSALTTRSREQKRDLLILVTPHIVDDGHTPSEPRRDR
jgi:catechol 2,3-dioxygenase-like lactoylglutathione lyase family enzyme